MFDYLILGIVAALIVVGAARFLGKINEEYKNQRYEGQDWP